MFKLKLVETHLFGVNISKISLIRVVTENMQLSVNKATKLLRLATTRYEMVITATSATPLRIYMQSFRVAFSFGVPLNEFIEIFGRLK